MSSENAPTGTSVERLVRRLPADVARCNGTIYANGKVVCQQRGKCLRFASPPHDAPNQCWVFVAGDDQVGNCSEFLNWS
jgi:hypothetical protein